jgi:hypothetical protein
MTRQPTSRLALAFGGALLALFLAPLPAPAQDGQTETEGPVTDPRTDKLIPRPNTSTPPQQTTDQLLPPVPASVQDPAPPGTNAVPALPGRAVAPRPGAAGRQPATRPGVRTVEGVVIAIEQPEGDEGASPKPAVEKVRLVIDPGQDWFQFVSQGPANIREDRSGPSRTAPEPADEADDQARPKENKLAEAVAGAAKVVRDELADDHADKAGEADRPAAVPVVLTSQTRVYAHARTEDGVDLHNVATASSPATRPDGVGVNGRLPRRAVDQGLPTNFTNIHVATPAAIPARPVPPAGAIPRDDNAVPARVPAIPAQPVGPGIPR